MSTKRVRIEDSVVLSVLKEASGKVTMTDLAIKLGMKETTLRAQVMRIKSKVTTAATAANKEFDFPRVLDGRAASSVNNADALLALLS